MQAQTNILTKRAYSGRNFTDLYRAQNQHGFNSTVWGTFRQFKMAGKSIKSGEHAAARVFQGIGTFTELDEETGKYKTETRPLGFAPVFNLDQTK